VFAADAVIDALNAALQNREESFDAISVDVIAHVLASAMAHRFMGADDISQGRNAFTGITLYLTQKNADYHGGIVLNSVRRVSSEWFVLGFEALR
jgi:hypothetical protein